MHTHARQLASGLIKTFLFMEIIFFSCTKPPPSAPITTEALISQVSACNKSAGTLKSNGFVEVSHDGHLFTVDFDLLYESDTNFTLEFSAPLGMVAASVRYKDNQSYIVDVGDTQYSAASSDFVDIGHGILKFPITWFEFITFFSGFNPSCQQCLISRDSLFVDKSFTTVFLKTRNCKLRPLDIIARLDNKSNRIHEIIYKPSNTSDWTVTFAQMTKYHSKEIKFVLANNNYFYVKYRSEKYLGIKGK